MQIVLLLLSLASAQITEPPAGPPVTDAAQAREIGLGIGDRIRCPVCAGQSVSASNSSSAVAIQAEIVDMVAAGYSDGQIEAYFVDLYGPSILQEPDRDDHPWVWWLPPLALIGAVGAAGVAAVRRKRAPQSPAPPAPAVSDEDRARVLRELEGE
jgi:cytochrome c-type biogenesis protein CcmH